MTMHFLKEKLKTLIFWQEENNNRKAGTFLKGWMDRSTDKNKLNQETWENNLIEKLGGI